MPRTVVIIALIVVGSSTAVFILSSQEEARPVLEIPDEYLDIGTVWVHDDFRWKLMLENHGGKPVKVAKLRASCLCTAVSRDRFVVPPKDSFEVALRLNLSASNDAMLTSAEWPFAVRLIPVIPGHPHRVWVLTGIVRSPFLLSSERLVFPAGSVVRIGENCVVSEESKKAAAMTLRCVHPVSDLAAVCDQEKMGSANLVRTGNADSPQWALEFLPSARLTVGVHRFGIRVTGITTDDQEAAVRLPATVAVVEDIELSPAVLHFGYVTVGSEPVSRTVRLRSRLNEPFTVRSIACDAKLLDIEQLGTADPDGEMRLRIDLTANEIGSHGTTVRIGVHYTTRQTTALREIRVLYNGMQSEDVQAPMKNADSLLNLQSP